jgi:hypothetical protein
MSPIGIWPVVIMVVDSGLNRRPAIPEISADLPMTGVLLEKLGMTVVTARDEVDLAGAVEAAGAAGAAGAAAATGATGAAGAVVSNPDAASINFFPAAAVMVFIMTPPLFELVATSVRNTLPMNPG